MSTNQIKALFLKNYNLLKRQKVSLICQTITPLLCLGFMFLIKILINENIDKIPTIKKNDLLYILNLPKIDSLNTIENFPLKTDTCEEWYLYSFDSGISESDKLFFGRNEGELPKTVMDKLQSKYGIDNIKSYIKQNYKKGMDINSFLNTYDDQSSNFNFQSKAYKSDFSSGILTSQANVAQKACWTNFKLSPYFEETKLKSDNSLNEDLFKRLEDTNSYKYDSIDYDIISKIPDGTIKIRSSNENEFNYNFQLNDIRNAKYHRANGISKIIAASHEVLTIQNGALWLVDILNKAYIRTFLPNLYIFTGVQIMPIEINNEDTIEKLINFVGVIFFPVSVSLLMPLFMYTIVLEKESKIIEMMKINGLKMKYYWFCMFIQNMTIYSFIMLIFFFFSYVVFRFNIFTHTSLLLQLIIYIGWGLCQNSIAFFFQAFISNSKISTCKFILL